MKISEFLSLTNGGYYYDSKVSSELFSKLVNDHGVPSGVVEFIGAIKKEYTMHTETSLLYRFKKESGGLGDCLKYLGTLISRIPLEGGVDLGIQEIDPTRSDGYYILFYLLDSVRE